MEMSNCAYQSNLTCSRLQAVEGKYAGFDLFYRRINRLVYKLAPSIIKMQLPVAKPAITLEQFMGVKLFAWVGGLALFLGIVFSLGSTSIIANIIAGYSMTYRRAFRVGDRIKVGDVVGDVTEVRLQVTHVRSLKNEDVVIPNSLILGSHVVNYSTLAGTQGLILHTTVGIGYETPWRQVEAMLLMAAARTPHLLQNPPPFVLQQSLGDFAITYELNAHCDRPSEMTSIYSDLHRNILDVFNEYGVAIMTPAYVRDPEQPKIVPQDQWYAKPARAPRQT